MKRTNRTREQAALICQVAASNGLAYEQNYAFVCAALGISEFGKAADLAFEAWQVATSLVEAARTRDSLRVAPNVDALAECLIRTGVV